MNREIKFRAKNSSGLWLSGNLIDCGCFKFVVDANELGKRPLDWGGHLVATCAVQEDTIGQFTGLKDKNGKEIYDGDILRCWEWMDGLTDSEYPRLLPVRFNSLWGGFFAEDFSRKEFFNIWRKFSKYEVVGNIYDNRELLEDKK